jgi:hypothetical protein
LNAAGVDQHAAPFLRARACQRRLTSPFRHWSCNRQDGAGLRGGYERGLRLLGSPLAHLAPPALCAFPGIRDVQRRQLLTSINWLTSCMHQNCTHRAKHAVQDGEVNARMST